jgi:hypothetical protein
MPTTGHAQSSSLTSGVAEGVKPYSKWGLIWYVDRSKTRKGSGVGLCRWGLRRGHSFSSGFLTTAFWAALYVINACVLENIEKGHVYPRVK